MKSFKNILKYFKIPSPNSPSSSIKPFTPNNGINVHQNKKNNDEGYRLPKNSFYNNVASPIIKQTTIDFRKLINKKIVRKNIDSNYHESAILLFYYWLRDEIIVKNLEKLFYKSKVGTQAIYKAFLAKNPLAMKLQNLLLNYDIRLKSERREKILIFFMVGTFLVLLLI